MLLFLHRDVAPCRRAREVSEALGLELALGQVALERLLLRGLVAKREGSPAHWRYASVSEATHSAVAQLADYDAHGRVELMALIAEHAVGRVRRRARNMFRQALSAHKKDKS